MERLYTIGAYGFDEEHFFGQLHDANVDLFLDLRRRRGMWGTAYSFANAVRLQQELEVRGIVYRHAIELAPLPETRELQRREDAQAQVAKRQRKSLGRAFVEDYTSRTLEPFDWEGMIRGLHAFRRPVLFCVERSADACHRSAVATRLARASSVLVTDLVPCTG
jgi:uncharacterized protein (DUF488 family)